MILFKTTGCVCVPVKLPLLMQAFNVVQGSILECKSTGKVYIGNTHRNFKKRMQEHFGDVRDLQKGNKRSDSYAKHFAKVYLTSKNPQLLSN